MRTKNDTVFLAICISGVENLLTSLQPNVNEINHAYLCGSVSHFTSTLLLHIIILYQQAWVQTVSTRVFRW